MTGELPPPRPKAASQPMTVVPSRALEEMLAILKALPAQVQGSRDDTERAHDAVLDVLREVQAVRRGLVGSPGPETAEVLTFSSPPALTPSKIPEPRPSLAVQTKRGALRFGKYGTLAVGALTLLSQLAAAFKPDYAGPLETILRLFQ